jgi:hypothetical protein
MHLKDLYGEVLDSEETLTNCLLPNSDANCKGTGFSFNASPGSKQFPNWIDNKSSSRKCVVDN